MNTFGIEVHTDSGVVVEQAPASWTIHDVAAMTQLMTAAGYVQTDPQGDALFAFKRNDGGTADVTPISPAANILQRIAGAKAHNIRRSDSGITAEVRDYESGAVYDVTVSAKQRKLEGVA